VTPRPAAPPGAAPRPLRALLRRPLVVGLAALLGVTATTLAGAGVLLAWLSPQASRADDVLSALQDQHVAMVNQETGLRGFLVSRDPQFLQPYRLGTEDQARLDARLRAWGRDDAALAADVDRLSAAENAWTRQWARPLLEWQPGLGDTAGLTDLLLRGKQLFDAYRVVEAGVRADVEHTRDVAVTRQRLVLLSGALLDLAVAVLVALAVRRANRRLADQLLPPTLQVREALAALAAGQLDRRAEEDGPQELRAIAGDVNHLGDALAERDALVASRERELVAARDQAEQAGAAKTAFLATMSHEIRTPLNAVLGLTDLLLTTALDAEQRDHLETIAGSGDALLALINDILDFSKIEAGELDLERAPFDLDDVVYDVAQLMAPQAAAKGLDLIVDVPPEQPWHVVGDAPRLRQVLLNLVGNAIKFTAQGVVVVRVTADVVGDRMSCRLAVSDTGIGIPADQHDRLFRSFSQVDASTTRSYGGTGLGLAISQRIAQAMGGGIAVDSEPGAGSTFTVSVQLQVPDSVPVRTGSDALAGCRILVVDDNPTNVTLLQHKLARYGAECVPATSGPAALAVAEREGGGLDAALLDLHMPGMPGDELAERLRALPATADLPLVLLSSSSLLPPDRAHLFTARLNKPARPERLLHTVQAALRREPTVAAPASPPAADAEGRRRLRVLVAEDNPVNARLMAMYLRQLGHDGDHVVNGEEAVSAVLAGSYDVVLMDAQMPVLGGVDATAAIRAMGGPQPRVVAVTASVLAEDRAAFLAAGADDFVTKPVRLATLAAALEPEGSCSDAGTPASRTADAVPVPRAEAVPAPRADAVPAPRAEWDAVAAAGDVLDVETVEELRDLGDEGFTHLYRQYLTGLDTMVAAILAVVDVPLPADEDGSLHRLAHKLKGSSAAMGATGLATICHRLEDAAAADTAPPALADELRALRAESDRVRAAVATLLAC
jgi:signal transduction histidine kinase/DNA-binding response OmpR family regulator/HPt (histidine-containing phosphotransfer) domain-containing protein